MIAFVDGVLIDWCFRCLRFRVRFLAPMFRFHEVLEGAVLVGSVFSSRGISGGAFSSRGVSGGAFSSRGVSGGAFSLRGVSGGVFSSRIVSGGAFSLRRVSGVYCRWEILPLRKCTPSAE